MVLMDEIPKMPPQPCVECGANMVLKRGRLGLFYGCVRYPSCNGLLPALPDGRPRGAPRSRALQRARNEIHIEIARLVKGDVGPTKGRVYEWLADAMSMSPRTCHASKFGVVDASRAVILLRNATPQAIHEWTPQRRKRIQ